MTPALLAAAGTLLYGPEWQAPMARDLDVADRTVRRWAAGQSRVPPGVADDLAGRLDAHATRLRAVPRQCRELARQLRAA